MFVPSTTPSSTHEPAEPTSPATRGLIFYGDPHGSWEPLLRACAEHAPAAVALLGDCGLEKPLREQIAPVFDAGIPVLWIPGNHDAHSGDAYDWLWGDHPEGNLHGRALEVGGIVLAGLGGVFKGRVWYPRFDDGAPVSTSRLKHLRQIARADQWRAGLPLRLRDAIFPEDIEALRRYRADILVTHEAPSSHKLGFAGIDLAAAACGARLIIYGHHHQSWEGTTASGVRVRGLAKAEVLRLRPEDLS